MADSVSRSPLSDRKLSNINTLLNNSKVLLLFIRAFNYSYYVRIIRILPPNYLATQREFMYVLLIIIFIRGSWQKI